MRQVSLDAVIHNTAADYVLQQIARFDQYPTLAPHVNATTVHTGLPEPVGSSSWELHFRSGLLRWTEQERFLTDQLRIEFAQTDGDFDEFSGVWQLRQDGADTALSFRCDFDFGIPSLEGILDPIAERVIRETAAWAVAGLFDHLEVTFAGPAPAVPVPAGDAG
ncbi:SRPBCC family protein [Actinoplanes teichomyceticus]|uniref:Ribosome-associated toxin RatA of RatAB toxin-antitoxin module n=1 Tax=Actinoplanes teichomyceticus TaxID=1867 RepID=A0A561WLP6_ACTTI|nr:SRPBCC family protein [Actinoplanes teichomyceticus]TWG24786.1 ribosome-associated toxin RatA of RatAB toxin-antitoxin module [Actinoplanes teichomyceticus]GIF14552.1 cyclase [Actinoplanes teichomyceticus]